MECGSVIVLYVGSLTPSSSAPLSEEISVWLAKVGETFDKLSRRLWNDRGIRVDTKMAVY